MRQKHYSGLSIMQTFEQTIHYDKVYSNDTGDYVNASNLATKSDEELQDFKHGLQASNAESVAAKLFQYIDASDYDSFKRLLYGNFFYEKLSRCSGEYYVGWTTEVWRVVTVFDELFFNNTEMFQGIMKKLNANTSMRESFYKDVNSRKESEVLFTWTKDIEQNTKAELAKLEAYAKILDDDTELGQEKSVAVNRVITQINTLLEKQPNYSHDILRLNTAESAFKILFFKLSLITTLHTEDQLLGIHRSWKRFITNFCTLLFSLGIANGLNYCLTGNFLFFNQTTTQEGVNGVHKSLGFDEGEFQSTHSQIEQQTKLPTGVVDLVVDYRC